MKIITGEEIAALGITPQQCVDWVREAFMMKNRCQLPAKMSVHPRGNDFINTMPCLLPEEYGRFGCKVVSRIKGAHPALKSELMMFDTASGEMIALVNADWITGMRTGAVAALAITTLRNSLALVYSFIGLGAMARATLDCMIATNHGRNLDIRLMRYKDQAERIAEEYAEHDNVRFTIVDNVADFMAGTDVVVSCITDADRLIVEDTTLFKPGVLVVPVHTRGFQNCDTIFDRVVADDRAHVEGFRYFNQFKDFCQLEEVLKGEKPGRTSDNERILAYNIGLGLHDVLFATKILDMLKV